MKISYIIVTYNSLHLIEDCINSIVKYNDDFEIIVIDNSPDEGNIKLFSYLNMFFPEVIKFKNESNLGYGHGNNIGVRYATGDIVCVMNPDVRLLERTDLSVIKEFKRDTNLFMLGFKQIGGNNLSIYIRPEYFMPLFHNAAVKILNSIDLFNKKFCYLSGALLFMKRDKFLQIGLFDEKIFMYNEEADITKRALKKNYNVRYLSRRRYLHLVGDRKEFSSFSHDAEVTSLKYYLNKYNYSLKKQRRLRLLDFDLKKILNFFNKAKVQTLDLYQKNFRSAFLLK